MSTPLQFHVHTIRKILKSERQKFMHRLSSTVWYVCTPTSRVTRSTSIVCSVRQSILASLFWNTNGALPLVLLGGACFDTAAWLLEWLISCLDTLRGFSQSLRNASSLSSVSVVYPVEEAMTMRPGSLIAFPMSLGELPTLSLVLADSNCFLGCIWRTRRLRAATVPATFEHVRVFLSAAHTAWAGAGWDSPLDARLTIPSPIHFSIYWVCICLICILFTPAQAYQ